MTDKPNAGHDLPDAPPHADYVGTPPGELPEEIGGELALVGNREAEGGLPEEAKPIDPKPAEVPQDANVDYTSGADSKGATSADGKSEAKTTTRRASKK